MSENKAITFLPQYSCQHDFPLDFDISNYHVDVTSSTPRKPPSFWIAKYQENSKPVHGNVNVLFNDEKNEPPSLDAQPEFNVSWIDNNSFKLKDENGNDIIVEAPSKDYKIQKKNINSIDISPSSAFVVTGEDDGVIKLIEIGTGNIPRIFEGHLGDINKVRFFPSGEVLLTAGTDLQIKIWSVLDGSNPVTLKGHSRSITDTGIISRGRNVLSSSKDGSIRLWECGSASTIRKICQLDTPINKMSLGFASTEYNDMTSKSNETVSLDPREVETTGKLVFASTDLYFNGYDLGKPGDTPVFNCNIFRGNDNNSSNNSNSNATLTSIKYCSNTNRIITGSDDGVVTLWDLRNTKYPQTQFKRNTSSITSLNVINNNEILISQADGQLYLCQINSNENSQESSPLNPTVKKEYVGSNLEPWYDVCVSSSGLVMACGRNGLLQKYTL